MVLTCLFYLDQKCLVQSFYWIWRYKLSIKFNPIFQLLDCAKPFRTRRSQGSFLWFILVGQTYRSCLLVILLGETRSSNLQVIFVDILVGQIRGSNSWIDLWVILGKEYAIKKLFFFCPTRLCITRSPVWSNIIIKHSPAIIKGKNISDAEHKLFVMDIGNNY